MNVMVKLALLGCTLIGVAVVLLVMERAGHGPADGATTVRQVPDQLVVSREEGVDVMRGSRFDRLYGSKKSTATRDLRLLDEVLLDTQLLIRDFDRQPLGDNLDFVRFLTGKNPHRLAWIPPDHPSIGVEGELLDRWGSPIFFHRLSATVTELRSSGEDREFWTADDILLEQDEALWNLEDH